MIIHSVFGRIELGELSPGSRYLVRCESERCLSSLLEFAGMGKMEGESEMLLDYNGLQTLFSALASSIEYPDPRQVLKEG